MKHFIAAALLAFAVAAAPACLSHVPLAAVQAQEQRLPIAVLNLGAKGGVSESEASIITDRIRTLVVQSGRFQVMERESMDKILREQGFQSTQDCESNACSIEIGRLLAVRAIVTGSVSRLGNLYTLNLRVIDVERGTILKEDFVDCNCALETLLVEKTGELLRRLLGTNQANTPALAPSAAPASSAPLMPSELTIRRARPFLATLEGGFINYGGLGLQYNIGDYFALRLAGGVIQYSTYGFLPDGSSTYTYDYPNFSLAGGVRVYFNPDPLAFFAEAYYSITPFGAARLGIEQRYQTGLTWMAALGWGFGAGSRSGGAFDGIVGIGYAF